MSGTGPKDSHEGTDQTALHPQRRSEPENEPSHVAEVSELGGSIDEPTIQGASFLVERITPVPPTRGQAQAMAQQAVSQEESTAAVQNPGPRPPAATVVTAQAVRVDPSGLQGVGAALAPMTRQHDAPPDVDTAYVPLPGQVPAAAPAPPGERATVLAGVVKTGKPNLLEQLKGSKNARLAIIAVGGVLSMGLTLLLFSPKPPSGGPPAPMVRADPGPPPATTTPPPPPPENLDPAKVEERDQLLERAILAVEAGRIDEALALFRRYSEEESNPASEFMVQLLQMQLSQSGKEP